MTRFFASDNCAPAHPEVLRAVAEAGEDHVHSYGDDPLTEKALALMKSLFVHGHGKREASSEPGVYFVFNGTGANVVAIASALRPGRTVICAEHAHINEDEGGAIEAVAGIKLRRVSTVDGKLRVADLESAAGDIGNVHRSQPGMVSITQTTEWGTMYGPAEIALIADWAHGRGLLLHMDGARLANAAAAQLARDFPDWEKLSSEGLRAAAANILRMNTVDAGVDVLSLGGTKNGLMFGEAVVFFTARSGTVAGADAGKAIDGFRAAAEAEAAFARKRFMQLPSKMRYISAQMGALYGGSFWITNALKANSMARLLADGLESLSKSRGWPGSVPDGNRNGNTTLRIVYPVFANAVFVRLPASVIGPLQEKHFFYVWDAAESVVRLMTSWDTETADVRAFLADLSSLLEKSSPGPG